MPRIVKECPLTKFPGGLQAIHFAGKDSVSSQAQHSLAEEQWI